MAESQFCCCELYPHYCCCCLLWPVKVHRQSILFGNFAQGELHSGWKMHTLLYNNWINYVVSPNSETEKCSNLKNCLKMLVAVLWSKCGCLDIFGNHLGFLDPNSVFILSLVACRIYKSTNIPWVQTFEISLVVRHCCFPKNPLRFLRRPHVSFRPKNIFIVSFLKIICVLRF